MPTWVKCTTLQEDKEQRAKSKEQRAKSKAALFGATGVAALALLTRTVLWGSLPSGVMTAKFAGHAATLRRRHCSERAIHGAA
jgi:hypothetical protein